MVVSDLLRLECKLVGSSLLNKVLYENLICAVCLIIPISSFGTRSGQLHPSLALVYSTDLLVRVFCYMPSCALSNLFIDDHVLMDVPELYWLGREGKWFGIRQFIAYMLDGLIQVGFLK